MAQDLIARLLANNAQWAADVEKTERGLLEQTYNIHAPVILWIGCCDARVPEFVMTGYEQGDIFVHRNIANQFHLNDDSALTVLTYAIETLNIPNIVVVGHTRCGGVKYCWDLAHPDPTKPPRDPPPYPPVTPTDRFLQPLFKLAKRSSSPGSLTEENVRAQVQQVAESEPVKQAWRAKKDIQIDGLLYDVDTGLLRNLDITVSAPPE